MRRGAGAAVEAAQNAVGAGPADGCKQDRRRGSAKRRQRSAAR